MKRKAKKDEVFEIWGGLKRESEHFATFKNYSEACAYVPKLKRVFPRHEFTIKKG